MGEWKQDTLGTDGNKMVEEGESERESSIDLGTQWMVIY